jgi:hypothetical protein
MDQKNRSMAVTMVVMLMFGWSTAMLATALQKDRIIDT